jgi:2-iminoacetate synthase ThiH
MDKKISAVLDSVLSGNRLGDTDALLLWREANFRDLGNVAMEIRNRLNPPGEVTYTAFRVVNYTNYCNVECSFCSFMDEVGSGKGYNLSKDEILKKVEEQSGSMRHNFFCKGELTLFCRWTTTSISCPRCAKIFPKSTSAHFRRSKCSSWKN